MFLFSFLMNFACHLICADLIFLFVNKITADESDVADIKSKEKKYVRFCCRWWSILVTAKAQLTNRRMNFAFLFSPFICDGRPRQRSQMDAFALWNRKESRKSAGHSNGSPANCCRRRRHRLWHCNEIDEKHSRITTCRFLLHIRRQFAIIFLRSVCACVHHLWHSIGRATLLARTMFSEFDAFHIFAAVWPGRWSSIANW